MRIPFGCIRVVMALLPALLTIGEGYCQKPPPVNITWLPVTDAERRMDTPVVDKDAGVEALFWRVHVVDEPVGDTMQRVLYNYVRLKIFNERGKESAAALEIPFAVGASIMSVAGRTVKPDGTVLELRGDAIHERDLIRVSGIKRKAKTFAMPGVEPGAIVEYRWKEIRFDPSVLYMRIQFQREFPVQKVTYHLWPLSRDYTRYRMGLWPFNCKPSPIEMQNDGFNVTALENVPAYKEEPMMPGEASVRPWALVVYRDDERREKDKYWNQTGKDVYRALRLSLRINGDIKAAAAKAVEGATSDEEKVIALIRYIRTNLRGLYDAAVTEAERAKVLRQMPKTRLRTSPEVFSSGIGTPDELNTLFAAMSSHIGLDARPALVASRDDLPFHPDMMDSYFLPNIDMAVKIGNAWKLYDVSTHLLPPGMLSWSEEGMYALVSDPKSPAFINAPLSVAEASTAERTARMALSADGTLEGDIEQLYTGHMAERERAGMDGESEAGRLELIKKDLLERYPGAEVTAISVEAAGDPEKPLRVRSHVKIPSYAQKTGRRLFIPPVFFQRGIPPLFASSERRYDIHFRHAWKEIDRVRIKLPAGAAVENAASPGDIDFGAPGGYSLEISTAGGELACTRQLVFGNQSQLTFAASSYPTIKRVFDEIHTRDNVVISLVQSSSPASKED